MGVPTFMVSIVFYTHWGNIRLTNCFCGGAHVHFLYCVLHALRQYQANELRLLDFPDPCLVLFCTHWGNIRLTNCFCGIAQIHVLYCVLHELRQYEVSKSLFGGRPRLCFVLWFIRIGAISG